MTSSPSSWAVPLSLGAIATAIIGARRLRSHPGLADLAAAATIGFGVCTAAALGATSLTVSAVALAGLVLCFLARSTSLLVAALSAAGYLATTLVQRSLDVGRWNHNGGHWTVAAAIDLGLLSITALLAAAVLTRRPSARPDSVLAIAGVAAVLAVIVSPDWHFTAATVVIALVGLFGTRRWPQLVVATSVMTATAAMIQLGDRHWSGVVALVISAAVAFAGRRTSPLSFAWTPQLVAAGWLALHLAGTTPNGLVGWMMVVGITVTGIAFTTPRLTALDSAAVTATALAALSVAAPGVHPAFASLVLLVGSAQGIAYGIAQRRHGVAGGSAVVGTCALVSLWFTSGTNAAVLSNLARFDFTGADLTVCALGTAMLVAGIGIRRWQQVSTWLAYGPGLALISAWIVAVQANRGADWAAITGLVVGITAIGVGGWRRMAAPLVIGTASLVTTVVIASGSQLASLPGWTWLVVGGVALLGLAAAIERHTADDGDDDGRIAGDNRGGLKAMLERFQ